MNILKNKIVHCKTEEQAKKLMQIAEDEGYKWVTGAEPTSHTNFTEGNKNGVTYFFDDSGMAEITYGIIISDYAMNKRIKFTDIEQQETKITNRNTTLGEKILVKDQENDDWQERYFLTVAHGLIYTTATEDGKYPFAWKYGIKKEEK